MRLYLVGLFIGVIILLFGFTNNTYASHAMGSDITYFCNDNPNTPNIEFDITVAFYRDCNGINAPSSITVDAFSPSGGCGTAGPWTINQQSSCGGSNTSGTEVTPALCGSVTSNCNGGTFPGVRVYYYCTTISLPPGCSDWTLSYSECCRNSQTTNCVSCSSNDQYVYATVNTTNNMCNNSPFFTSLPVPFFCPGIPINYNHGTVDIDGDSLVYELVAPLDAWGMPITYVPPFSATYPLATTPPNSFGFDQSTGQMNFTAQGTQIAVVAVLVKEYRNGVLIGTTMRDIQIVILSPGYCGSNPPMQNIDPGNISGGGLIDSVTIQMCPGTTISFQIDATDVDGDVLTMTTNIAQAFLGASSIPGFTTTPSGPSVTGTFTWSPTGADAGANTFIVTIDEDACPSIGIPSIVAYTIIVYDQVIASPNNSVFCNDSIQLNALGGSVFLWTPAAGLSDPTIANPKAGPLVPTMYTVTTDCGQDSVFVDVQPDFFIDAGPDSSICLNQLVQLNPTLDTLYDPYTYLWTPNFGLNNNTFQNPNASPGQTTTYTLTATSRLGCINDDSLTITIQGVAPNVVVSANPDSVCPGGATVLDISKIPSSCGLNTTPCNTSSIPYQIGAQTLFDSNTRGYPAIYGNYYKSVRNQILFLATELNNLGIQGGSITDISFEIAQLNEPTYTGFTIKMACVGSQVTQLTSFQTGTVTVLNPRSVNPTAGWNTYIFDNAYDWDGVSNLVVEICYDNTLLGVGSNSPTYYSTTPFNSVVWARSDVIPQCNVSTVSGTSNQRPNTIFGACLQTTNATYSWSPPNLLNDPTLETPTARPMVTTGFFVDVDEGGCVGQGYVQVFVDNSLTLTAEPDTSLCSSVPIQLDAIATGTPQPILLSCGVNSTDIVGTSNSKDLANGDGVSGIFSPFNGSDDDGRTQMLYRATELDAAGVKTGVITEISFDVAFKSSFDAFSNFNIKMSCTSLDVLGADFEPNLTTVYSSASVTTVAGWNTFILDNPFDWDGYGNIIVEVCFDGPDWWSVGSDIVNYSNTSFISVLAATGGYLSAGCTLSSTDPNVAFQSSNTRPDIRFIYHDPPPGVFTYLWTPSTGLSSDTIQNPTVTPSSSIEYYVNITDGNCIAFDTVTIDFYQGYDANMHGNNVGCNGSNNGNLISAPIGGVSPYDFEWDVPQFAFGQLTDTVFNLGAGTYQLTVTDNNNCVQLDTFTLTVPPPLVLTLTPTDVSCFGLSNGEIQTNVTGGTVGYNYLWSNTDSMATATSLAANSYTVTVTDASGCTIVDSSIVTEPTAIITTTNITDASCFGYNNGDATVTVVSGGTTPFNYNWIGSGSFNSTANYAYNMEAGAYQVVSVDYNGCSKTDTIIVSEPDSFQIVITTIPTNCYNSSDGEASATADGVTVNYTFNWLTTPPQSGANATNVPRGPITVEVTNAVGCIQSQTDTIGSPPQAILNSDSTDVTCYGDSNGTAQSGVVSGGVGPFNYLWSDGQNTYLATGLPYGEITLIVTDVQGCEEFDTLMINQPDPITIDTTTYDVSCFGLADGSIAANAQGGTEPFNYNWSNYDTGDSIYGLSADIYSVTVTDYNNCVNSLTGILIIEPTAIFFTNVVGDTICPQNDGTGTASIEISGGTLPYTYTLLDSFEDINSSIGNFINLDIGQHTLLAADNNGCEVDTIIEINAYTVPTVIFNPDEIDITLGEDVLLAPIITPSNGNYIYLWEPESTLDYSDLPEATASPNVTTVYEVTITTEDGCTEEARITVYVENDLILYAPNVFTPNGDGVNDVFIVQGISLETIHIVIYDRWGEKVFETSELNGNISGGWDGTFHGKKLASDVFVYYIESTYIDGLSKTIKGSITILK